MATVEHAPEEPQALYEQPREDTTLEEAEKIASNDQEKETMKAADSDSVHSDSSDVVEMDPFVPFPIDPDMPVEEHILTFRAIFIGCLLGALVNASNVYLGMFLSSFLRLL